VNETQNGYFRAATIAPVPKRDDTTVAILRRQIGRRKRRSDYNPETNGKNRVLLSRLSLFGKGTALMEKAYVEELASKHAALHAMIDEEEHRSHPDEDLLHRLKKEKLKLKDALAGHYEH